MPVQWINPMRVVAGTYPDDNGNPIEYYVDITAATQSAEAAITQVVVVNEHPTRAMTYTVTANGVSRTFAVPAGRTAANPVTVTSAQIVSIFGKQISWAEVDSSGPVFV